MAGIRTSNNPLMLRWARDEIGHSLEEAADAIGVTKARLLAAESGDKPLTLKQLRKAADKYECPFGYFYLSKPPYEHKFEQVPDFRTAPEYVGVHDYRLNLEIKKIREHRETYLEILKDLGEEITQFKVIKNVKLNKIGTRIRKRLHVSDHEISNLRFEHAYSYWKERIEEDGVLVYESQYVPDSTGVMGAAIYYDQFPIILIKRGGFNNSRKLFTLMHEYAHLLIGASAINDSNSQFIDESKGAASLESRCNRLAAEILTPSEVIDESRYRSLTATQMMELMANDFKITYSTAAVCLRRAGLIDQDDLDALLESRRREHSKKQEGKTGDVKIPRETIMRLDLGRPMFSAVLSAYSNGLIDVIDASKILHLRVHKIDKLVGGV